MPEPLAETPVALPASFFTEVLPCISDLGELRVTLAMYHRAASGAALVAEADLTADPCLRRGLLPLGSARDPATAIRHGLERAVSRGTLLAIETAAPDGGRWYALNTPDGREIVAQVVAGQRALAAGDDGAGAARPVATQPTIFRLYEQHVAVLTPLVAQQLAEAADEYPAAWIAEAFDEAVARNRRSWRFIRHLLDRWASEGKDHATHRRYAEKPLDTTKYTKGKYAAIFRREYTRPHRPVGATPAD